jgi:excinuclease UvrABC ATPase subunit
VSRADEIGGRRRLSLAIVVRLYEPAGKAASRGQLPGLRLRPAAEEPAPRGMCPECEGLARVSKIDVDALVDKNKSLADSAILFPTFNVDRYHWAIFANSGFFDVKKKLRDYTKSEWDKFLYLDDPKVKVKPLANLKSPFEGLIVKFKRLYLGKDAEQMRGSRRTHFERIVTRGPCDSCGGTRLGEAARA